MGLNYGMNVAVIGFIDCMFGFVTFIYCNIQDYRHIRHGNPDEVFYSYSMGIFGFIKGLILCIPTAQVMVNRERALVARRAVNSWYFLTSIQVIIIMKMIITYIWPMDDGMESDIFLFVIRIKHICFLIFSIYFIYSFRQELHPLIPRNRKTCCYCCPSCSWSLTRNKARTSAASVPDSDTGEGGNREEAYAE